MTVTTMPFRVNSQKEIGLSGSPGDPQYDDVGAGADGGEVATQVGAEDQGPPQHLGLAITHHGRHQLPDNRSHRRGIRDVVDDAAEQNDTVRINIVVSKRLPPVAEVAKLRQPD